MNFAPIPPLTSPGVNIMGANFSRKEEIVFDLGGIHRFVLLVYIEIACVAWAPWFELKLMDKYLLARVGSDDCRADTMIPDRCRVR